MTFHQNPLKLDIKWGKEKFVLLHFWKEHRKPGFKPG